MKYRGKRNIIKELRKLILKLTLNFEYIYIYTDVKLHLQDSSGTNANILRKKRIIFFMHYERGDIKFTMNMLELDQI